jgi:hypothetical protein
MSCTATEPLIAGLMLAEGAPPICALIVKVWFGLKLPTLKVVSNSGSIR